MTESVELVNLKKQWKFRNKSKFMLKYPWNTRKYSALWNKSVKKAKQIVSYLVNWNWRSTKQQRHLSYLFSKLCLWTEQRYDQMHTLFCVSKITNAECLRLVSQVNVNAKKKKGEGRNFQSENDRSRDKQEFFILKIIISLEFTFPAVILRKLQPQKWKIYVFLDNH